MEKWSGLSYPFGADVDKNSVSSIEGALSNERNVHVYALILTFSLGIEFLWIKSVPNLEPNSAHITIIFVNESMEETASEF